ncbi:DUF2380 domain-containing protein [Enterovibrio baiacu]|uniref:DUF2380 domain-containing protein n=1 Tax=Enterovibrio baiacu TaxID=2491023 RepID=UPI003D131E58
MRRNKYNEMPFVVKKTISGIKPFLVMLLIALLLGWIPIGFASVVELDFELKDMTVPAASSSTNTSQAPDNHAEIARTASLAPLLRQTLHDRFHTVIITVPTSRYLSENHSVGYLFDRPQNAANLGSSVNAEWIIVSRLHKPSHLFAYLISRLIHVPSGQQKSEIIIEIKGQQATINQRGINKLAAKINEQISR